MFVGIPRYVTSYNHVFVKNAPSLQRNRHNAVASHGGELGGFSQGVSHSFYFGVKSNSNSFGKKGVKSTPPLLFDFKRSESITPLPTPLKTLISIFF